MKALLGSMVTKKPHPGDPLRLYEKETQYIQAAAKLSFSVTPAQTAYPPELLDDIFARFSSILGFQEPMLAPLKQAMEVREIDLTRLPLGEVPAFSLPYAEDDLAVLLYLLSKPWFLALRQVHCPDNLVWDDGRCPVCMSRPVVTWSGGDGQRLALCLFCNTRGYIVQRGCPVCLEENSDQQNLLLFEGEEGYAILTCDLCRSYVKTIHPLIVAQRSPEIADLMSLPLDILVQKKGYSRRAPNPIGMRKMTLTG